MYICTLQNVLQKLQKDCPEIMEQKVREYEKIYNELETQIRPKRKKRRTASEIKKNYLVSNFLVDLMRWLTGLVSLQRLQEEVWFRCESQFTHQEEA